MRVTIRCEILLHIALFVHIWALGPSDVKMREFISHCSYSSRSQVCTYSTYKYLNESTRRVLLHIAFRLYHCPNCPQQSPNCPNRQIILGPSFKPLPHATTRPILSPNSMVRTTKTSFGTPPCDGIEVHTYNTKLERSPFLDWLAGQKIFGACRPLSLHV